MNMSKIIIGLVVGASIVAASASHAETAKANTESMTYYLKGHAVLPKIRWSGTTDLASQAKRDLEKSVELDANNPKALASLGWFNFLASQNAGAMGDIGKADILAQKSMAIEESALATMLQAAILFEKKKADEEALALGKKALDSTPDDILLVNYYGSMLLRTGQLKEAVNLLEVSKRIDPQGQLGRPRFGLGFAYLLAGNPSAAEPILRSQSAMDGSMFPLERIYYIAALAGMGKQDDAKKVAEEYVKACWKRNGFLAWCNAFSVRNLLQFSMGFRDVSTLQPLFAGLQKAGFPEEPE